MSVKPSPKKSKPALRVSQGNGWYVEYSRTSKDFSAIIEGVGCIGCAKRPSDAQTLINEYRFEQARRAA